MTELPVGLTHPYDSAGVQATTFRHGMTFTWTRGEPFVAIQRGRVVNCRRTQVFHDVYPGVEILLGRLSVVDWMPAPRPPVQWRRPSVMQELADRWQEQQAAGARRSA